MIVMKFGGTSVESAEAIERVTGIVQSRLDRKPVVVVSAMGKTTNKLLAIAKAAVTGDRDRALGMLYELRDFICGNRAWSGRSISIFRNCRNWLRA
jgi:aspartate kinase